LLSGEEFLGSTGERSGGTSRKTPGEWNNGPGDDLPRARRGKKRKMPKTRINWDRSSLSKKEGEWIDNWFWK